MQQTCKESDRLFIWGEYLIQIPCASFILVSILAYLTHDSGDISKSLELRRYKILKNYVPFNPCFNPNIDSRGMD